MARHLRRTVDRWGRGRGTARVAVGDLWLLGSLVDVGAGFRPIGSVRLLRAVSAVGHLPAVRRVGCGDSRLHGSRIGSRLRIGSV
ncbi:MAG TPA: hypothetical protein VM428_00605, partial [Microlunatus sp.]|nr:hypothetical protein [Microlunatus sp.]